MADVEGVAVVEGMHDLVEDVAGFGFTEVALSSNSFEEFTTGADFHNEVNISTIFEDFVEFNDVGMIELLHDFNFVLETCGVLDLGFGDGLDGSGGLGDLVDPSEDSTITSCA